MRAFSLNYWAINLGFGVSAAGRRVHRRGRLPAGSSSATPFTTVLCALVVFAQAARDAAAAGRPTAAAASGEAPDAVGLGTVLRDRRFMGWSACPSSSRSVFQQGSVGPRRSRWARPVFTPATTAWSPPSTASLIVALQIPVTRALRARAPRPARRGLLAARLGLRADRLRRLGRRLRAHRRRLDARRDRARARLDVGGRRPRPATARGRYQGMYTLSWSAAAFAGPLGGGLTLDHLGRGAVWAGCALVGTVAAAGYYLLLRTDPAPRPATATAAGVAAPRLRPPPRTPPLQQQLPLGLVEVARPHRAGVPYSLQSGVQIAGEVGDVDLVELRDLVDADGRAVRRQTVDLHAARARPLTTVCSMREPGAEQRTRARVAAVTAVVVRR